MSHATHCSVQIWERLQLTVGEGADQGVYSCRVTDIEKNRLMISRPIFEYGHAHMADNYEVTASFTRADAAYSFSARIKETEPKFPDAMYLIFQSNVERIQRRRFVRLDLRVPLVYAVLSRPVAHNINLLEMPFDTTCTINISAGGVLIPVNSTVSATGILIMGTQDQHLKKMPAYMLGACRHVQSTESGKSLAGVEFILMEYLDRYLSVNELIHIPSGLNQFSFKAQNELAGELFTEQLVLRQKRVL